MPIRKLEEINAGSMADIAFLLLIFFIVTTTMSLESGIVQTMPEKTENPYPQKSRDRDVFLIHINANDELQIEGESVGISEIESKLYDFYTANMFTLEANPKQVEYLYRDLNTVEAELAKKKNELLKSPHDRFIQSDIKKLEKRRLVCKSVPGQSFLQINELGAVQIKQMANTSYGTYIAVRTEVGKVIDQLRDTWSREIFNGISYFDLDRTNPLDHDKIVVLETLVPGKILEPEITN